MKKLKIKLFQRTLRLFRRYVRWENSEFHTDEDKREAYAQYLAFYDFLSDSGLEQEYCDWYAQILEAEEDAA